eukprot:4634405-Prymnesium_polylepis.1
MSTSRIAGYRMTANAATKAARYTAAWNNGARVRIDTARQMREIEMHMTGAEPRRVSATFPRARLRSAKKPTGNAKDSRSPCSQPRMPMVKDARIAATPLPPNARRANVAQSVRSSEERARRSKMFCANILRCCGHSPVHAGRRVLWLVSMFQAVVFGSRVLTGQGDSYFRHAAERTTLFLDGDELGEWGKDD